MVHVPKRRAATILVVEDDQGISELYSLLLVSQGYDVLIARSAQAALTDSATRSIDGVLLDRRLPDMDGLTLCPILREQLGPTVPVIMITADHGTGLEAAAHAAGATDFLQKPFRNEDLLRRLAAHL